MARPKSPRADNPARSVDVATESKKIEYGEATEMWLELKPFGGSAVESLWLLVKGMWLHLDKPSPEIQSAVQSAFCNCPDRLQILVWYYEPPVGGGGVPASTAPPEVKLKDDRAEIKGLVIRSK